MRARIANGGPLDAETLFQFVTRAERLSLAAVRLMREVLTEGVAAPGDGAAAGEPEEVDLEEALATAVAVHADALLKSRCSIVVTRDEGVSRLRGPWDRRALESIFSNLLQNVCRHAAGAPVGIRFGRSAGAVLVRFSDHGPGLPRAIPGRPVAAPIGPDAPGFGLGIRIVSRAVASLQGELSVTSAPGRGVTFEIRLPTSG
jgi:signal transduction histidine kinase